MTKMLQTGIRNALCVAVLATLAGCAENQAVTQSQTLASQAAIPQAAGPEPVEAKDILLRMAGYLAKTPKFTVAMSDNYDTLQESGQKIEFGEKRKISVSRPNGLRVEIEESHGEKHLFLYDGKDMTVFNPSQNVYAQTAKAGGIDEAVVYLLKDLHMRLPRSCLAGFPRKSKIAPRPWTTLKKPRFTASLAIIWPVVPKPWIIRSGFKKALNPYRCVSC